ncbi:hypothetical protein QZJ86_00065 [Methylomonas montana]|uniref:hypothetical protein n=1 Tax=Methylomonas montana TaxID=3058963 RepID=UPI00265A0ADE|nr:hypothetical protein [Methylomonas montana]WKJ90562.1 hypothetical protein QZJ86_00065 [Methylomonas montana]
MKTIIQRINDLAGYLDNTGQNRGAAVDVISKLQESHDDACKNEYSKPELVDLIFSRNDCLATEGADELPEKMREDIITLQQEIVDTYGLQD